MKNSSYYIAPAGDRTHDLPHTVASNTGKVSHALTHSVHYPLNNVAGSLSGKPTFVQCNTTVWGLLATENLEIKCGFRSWPAFSLLTWYAETTGQTIENDNSDEGLEAYVTVSTRVVGVFKYSEFSQINSQMYTM